MRSPNFYEYDMYWGVKPRRLCIFEDHYKNSAIKENTFFVKYYGLEPKMVYTVCVNLSFLDKLMFIREDSMFSIYTYTLVFKRYCLI